MNPRGINISKFLLKRCIIIIISGFIMKFTTGSIGVVVEEHDRIIYNQPVVVESIWLKRTTGRHFSQ